MTNDETSYTIEQTETGVILGEYTADSPEQAWALCCEDAGYSEPQPQDELGEPQDRQVIRDGDRDLRFRGWRVGKGTTGSGGSSGYACDWNRGTRIRIWITTGGRIVTGAEQWSCWQGEGETHRAAAHKTPEAALAWLTEDSYTGDHLGPASKEAWEDACTAVPSLAGLDVEMVA